MTSSRGQTTLDFATGVSIFLFTLVFVFAFVPGMLQPFTESSQGETASSDRVADLIVQDLLAEPGQGYVLDGSCTAALMGDRSAPECGFDGATLKARLDLSAWQHVNVTMRGDVDGDGSEFLCWDENHGQTVEASGPACDGGDVALRAGTAPPADGDSVVTARRIASVDETVATIEVRLW